MIESGKDKKSAGPDTPAKASFDPNGPIGRKLRSFYDAVETEAVPGHLLDLLERLDEAERKAGGKS